MKKRILFFWTIVAFGVLTGCRTSRKAITPTQEILKKVTSLPLTDSLLTNLLGAHSPFFDSILAQKEERRIQIIYTQIDRKEGNSPVFTNYYYNVDPAHYFYPASTVKLPVAALALQRIRELNIDGLTPQTTIVTEPGGKGLTPVYNDPTAEDGRPTIAHYIKKILLVSDNDAFNRLYEFLGQDYINTSLHKKGYDSAQILHRLNISLSEEQNRQTNPIRFFDTAAKVIYAQPLVKSNYVYQPRTTFLGKGYYRGGKLVEEPFDFSAKNRLSLPDLHSIVQSILFPEAVSKRLLFDLEEEDYRFLRQYMSMLPRESRFPQYDTTYNDSYVKFLLYGGNAAADLNIRIFNKVGDAYGFLTDAAYIVDFEKGIEFMLSATIHCNSDGIYNDDRYEYETIGFPFMKALGQIIYQHELTRPRTVLPDLSHFKMEYNR